MRVKTNRPRDAFRVRVRHPLSTERVRPEPVTTTSLVLNDQFDTDRSWPKIAITLKIPSPRFPHPALALRPRSRRTSERRTPTRPSGRGLDPFFPCAPLPRQTLQG